MDVLCLDEARGVCRLDQGKARVQWTIIGPGAMGCLTAFLLARAGEQVTVCGRNREQLAPLATRGIVCEGMNAPPVTVAVEERPHSAATADTVLLCVKSYDVEAAVEAVAPHLNAGGVVIALQNGIGHHRLLAERLPGRHALGVTALGATRLGPGHIRFGGRGKTEIGAHEPPPSLAALARAMSTAGIQTTVSPDITAAVWNKLIVNIGINALTAIHGCPNGALLERPDLETTQAAAVAEAEQVARALGVAIAGEPLARVRAVCAATANNRSSMLQDIEAGRRTEIMAINGAVAALGRRLGIATPVNEQLTAAIRDLEGGRT